MGQGPSTEGGAPDGAPSRAASSEQRASCDAHGRKEQGGLIAALKRRTSKSSARSSAESHGSFSRGVADAQQGQRSTDSAVPAPSRSSGGAMAHASGADGRQDGICTEPPGAQQQQAQHTLPPRPARPPSGLVAQGSMASSNNSSASSLTNRRSGSLELGRPYGAQGPGAGGADVLLFAADACGDAPPAAASAADSGGSESQLPPRPRLSSGSRGAAPGGRPPAHPSQQQQQQRGGPWTAAGGGGAAEHSGLLSRASFSRDAAAEPEQEASAAGTPNQQVVLQSSLFGPSADAGSSSHSLHTHTLKQHNQQHGGGKPGAPPHSSSGSSSRAGHAAARASVDSCASKASSVGHSVRSSFAAEALPRGGEEEEEEEGDLDVDQYGRPSFAAFESADRALSGRGAVFEASLPPDLRAQYLRLGVLLPQAPIPLVTVLQLWGITDAHEAQESVQIFVMQGVLKVATLPDGTTWLMVSPEHQQCILADHHDAVRGWHQAVLDVYRRQVVTAQYLQLHQLVQQGALTVEQAQRSLVDVAAVEPGQFPNDGYIWLSVTHHLMGAGQLAQVRALLMDPTWLEAKLHCYGVAAVVEDFRSYLQASNDLSVKAVLQAFQMSLSCCMERSHLPMMRHQLVLRLMAAARNSGAGAAGGGGPPAPSGQRGSGGDAAPGGGRPSGAQPPRATTSSESVSGASAHQMQLQFQQEMASWFDQQYRRCRSHVVRLAPAPGQQQQQQQQQQQGAPHLLGYTPSLRQAGGRHRMALRGHLGPIRRVVITPDGKDVLTASDDGGVQVWDMDIGDCVMQLTLPAGLGGAASPTSPGSTPSPAGPPALTALAVTADGGCCLTGDVEGWLSCWSLRAGQLVQRVRAHRGRINALALDPGGSRCITAGQDARACLWTLPVAMPAGAGPGGAAGAAGAGAPGAGAGGGASVIGSLQLEMEMSGHGLANLGTGAVLDVAVSADGSLGASASDDLKLRVWDLDQQSCIKTCLGHSGWVVSVRFIGNTHNLVTGSHDGTARVWDAWTGECLGTLIGHSGRINAVRCSSDGRAVVTCSDDLTARIWETYDYTCIGVLQGHTGWVNDVAFLRGSSQVVTISGDGTARLWDTRRGSCLQVLQGHSDDVTCVVLTSRGRFVVTGSVDGTAQVWDLAAQDVSSTDVHDGKVIGVVCCPNGSHAASIGADGCLRLWDLATGACLSNVVAHTTAVPLCLLMTADGSRAFSGSGARKLVFWDMKSGAPRVCVPAQQGSRAKSVHTSADGSAAVVLLFDSSISVFDTATGSVRCRLMQRGDRDVQRVHSGGVNAAFLTADGGRAVSVSKDTTARVWDTATGACTLVLQGHSDSVHTAAISTDEAVVATASFDCTVRLWDLATGACLKVLQHTDPVMCVAFSPGQPGEGEGEGGSPGRSRWLVTGCGGCAVWLWDTDTGACVAALGEHKEAVTSVAFSPCGEWLATTSQDRSVLVWEAATGRLAGLYVGDAAMVCCSFGSRGAAKPQPQHGAGDATDPAQQPEQQQQQQQPAEQQQQQPEQQQQPPEQQQQQQQQQHEEEPPHDEAAPRQDEAAAQPLPEAVAPSDAQRAEPTRAASTDAPGPDAGGADAADAGTPRPAPAGVLPLPGGLTLVVGDASGNVHFVDCLSLPAGP